LIHVGDHFGKDEGTGDPADQACQDGDERTHLRAILPAAARPANRAVFTPP